MMKGSSLKVLMLQRSAQALSSMAMSTVTARGHALGRTKQAAVHAQVLGAE